MGVVWRLSVRSLNSPSFLLWKLWLHIFGSCFVYTLFPRGIPWAGTKGSRMEGFEVGIWGWRKVIGSNDLRGMCSGLPLAALSSSVVLVSLFILCSRYPGYALVFTSGPGHFSILFELPSGIEISPPLFIQEGSSEHYMVCSQCFLHCSQAVVPFLS